MAINITIRFIYYDSLQLRKPRHDLRHARERCLIPHLHLSRSNTSFLRRTLIDENRRIFLCKFEREIGLPRQRAIHICGAGGDPADDFATFIHDGIAVMRHSHALLGEGESCHNAFAFLLIGDIGIPPDEVGFVGLDIGAKSAFGYAEIGFAHLSGAKAHFMTVEG